ncbi:MAG: S8 family serine peptidase, partial [Patescibacteria group bacterium]
MFTPPPRFRRIIALTTFFALMCQFSVGMIPVAYAEDDPNLVEVPISAEAVSVEPVEPTTVEEQIPEIISTDEIEVIEEATIPTETILEPIIVEEQTPVDVAPIEEDSAPADEIDEVVAPAETVAAPTIDEEAAAAEVVTPEEPAPEEAVETQESQPVESDIDDEVTTTVITPVNEPVSIEKKADEGRRNELDLKTTSKLQRQSVPISNLSEQKSNKQEKQNYVEGEVLVKFKEQKINLEQSSGRTKAMQFATGKNLEKKEDIRKSNISVLKIKDTKTVEEKIAELKNDSRVEYVQPNFQYYPLTLNANLWGLNNTGQEVNGVSGTDDKDIDAPEAWAISEGEGSNIIVAVIDSGVAYNHPDLANNMWDGNGCSGLDKNGNSIGGGCQHGYDYEDNDKIPLPTSSSHGTHIAGTIGAEKNGSGIIGVAPNVKIMALKVALTTDQILMAIDFAESNNAKVINASWGGASEDTALYNAINSFPGLFIAAAGNNGSNNESAHFYPSDYDLDNIISVAATDQNDALATFSNYGATSVDVGAPGVNIYSTVASIESFSEDFETATLHEIGTQFMAGGDTPSYWGVEQVGSQKALFTDDRNLPYIPNEYAYIESGNIN